MNIRNAVDKPYYESSLKELLDAPPSALSGLTEKHDEILAEHFRIKTIADLADFKYVALAQAIRRLAAEEL